MYLHSATTISICGAAAPDRVDAIWILAANPGTVTPSVRCPEAAVS
jgi:hypothetical protein